MHGRVPRGVSELFCSRSREAFQLIRNCSKLVNGCYAFVPQAVPIVERETEASDRASQRSLKWLGICIARKVDLVALARKAAPEPRASTNQPKLFILF
jgi:hypothetical protein